VLRHLPPSNRCPTLLVRCVVGIIILGCSRLLLLLNCRRGLVARTLLAVSEDEAEATLLTRFGLNDHFYTEFDRKVGEKPTIVAKAAPFPIAQGRGLLGLCLLL
jgi:hypothetical protein